MTEKQFALQPWNTFQRISLIRRILRERSKDGKNRIFFFLGKMFNVKWSYYVCRLSSETFLNYCDFRLELSQLKRPPFLFAV